MDKKTFKLAALFMSMLAMFTFSSCSDDDDAPTAPENNNTEALAEHRVTLSRKTEYGNDWIYFSLSQGKELTGINEENRESNKTWDLAFNRYNVRTNSGLSGKGKGGAADTGKTKMSEVTTVPDLTFEVDEMGKITSKFTGSGVEEIDSPLNKKLSKAIDFQGPPPTYTPNNHVYIVRTADGKYAKIKIENFYNDEGKSGFVTFTYVYQPDGSINLK